MANGETLNALAHDNPVGNTKYIYVIRNNINDKVYVGEAEDVDRDFYNHVYDKENHSIISKAIKKYGKDNFYYEVLCILGKSKKYIKDYWINFFHSISPDGYNSLDDINVNEYKPIIEREYIAEENLPELYNLLRNNSVRVTEISSYFSVSYKTIKDINAGYMYFNKHISYPIRLLDDFPDYVTENIEYSKLEQIILDLQEGILSKHQIATKNKTTYSCVNNINTGKSYFSETLCYPLKKHNGRYDFSEEVYEDIRRMLKNNISPKHICDFLHLPNIKFVYDINAGESHRSENYNYPIQSIKGNCLKSLVVKLSDEIAHTKKSLSLIAKENNVSKNLIITIKNGNCLKYRLPDYSYPLRPNR